MNLIASVLHLDRKAIKELKITDPYSLHRVVYSLYGDVRSDSDKVSSKPSGILYADHGGDAMARRILMLSNRSPEPSVNGEFGQVQSKTVPPEFLEHRRYRFKVVVNPTCRENASRKLVPVKGRGPVAKWFCERARTSWGFLVLEQHLQVDKIEVQSFQAKQGRKITLAQAHLQGELRVIDHERFQKSFSQGIGRGRAFGCGLLQLVPVSASLFD